ncbi:hypothetical protein HWV62_31621 [Athelia sp. TMB]|nr:hypothetical protein HWV62_31621 [Athelia sp. TMB]
MNTVPIQYSSRDPVRVNDLGNRTRTKPRNDQSSSHHHTAADDLLSYEGGMTRSTVSRHEHMPPLPNLQFPHQASQSSSPASFSTKSVPALPGRMGALRPGQAKISTTPAPMSNNGITSAPMQPRSGSGSPYPPTRLASHLLQRTRRVSSPTLTDSDSHRYGHAGPEDSPCDHAHTHDFPSAPESATKTPADSSTTPAMNTTTTSMPTQAIADYSFNQDIFGSSTEQGHPLASHASQQNSNANAARPIQNQPIDETQFRSHHSRHCTPPAKHKRTQTGYSPSSEGGTAISVDMKRLLSKPAPPSSSTRSLPGSDSELPSGSRMRSASSKSESGSVTREYTRSRSQPDLPQLPRLPFQQQETSASSSPSLSPATTRTEPSPPLSSEETRSQTSTQKSPRRNVLKRRPSAPRMPSNTSSASSPLPKHAGSGLRIDSDLARGASRTSTPLTPAGAVAEAYKQQEQRRASGAAGADDLATPRVSDQRFDTTHVDTGNPPSPVPYYTVIGTSSGRLVAVGGPSDRWLDGYSATQRPKTEDKAASTSHGRSLSRKLSARWRKAPGGSVKSDRTPPSSENTSALSGWSRADEVAGEESAERRSMSLPRERTKSGGSAVRSDLKTPDSHTYGRSMASMQGASSSAWVSVGVPDGVDEHGRVRGEKSPTKAKEEGGKVWKLMKRISTGGLRDKYHVDKAAPPVPSLPKDFMHRSWTRGSGSGESGESPTGGLARFISRSSLSTPLKTSPSISPRPSISTPVTKPVPTGRRPSMATGSSSSPVSSDVASSRFFHRTHSARSSTSSLGDIITPPMPTTLVGKHIVPPGELHRINAALEIDARRVAASSTTRAPHRAATMPESDPLPPPDRSPDEMRIGQLPLPPRRATATGQQVNYQSNPPNVTPLSPDIPLFSNVGAINTFSSHATTARVGHTQHVVPSDAEPFASPPALPARSAKRPPPQTSAPSSVTSQTTHSDMEKSRRSHDVRHVQDKTGAGRSLLRRKSSEAMITTSAEKASHSSKFSTISARRNPSSSTTRSPSATRSPLTFRKLDTEVKPALTAQEKADIWDNLLEKSERAGGTLHIGGQELISDRMKMESSLSLYSDSL